MSTSRFLYLLLLAVLLAHLGCASTRKAFEQASNLGTIEAYEEFVSQHPNDPLAREARGRIIAIEFETAKRENSAEAYDRFLSHHTSGPWAEKAHRAKLDLEIDNIKSNGPGDRPVIHGITPKSGSATTVTFTSSGGISGDLPWVGGGRMSAAGAQSVFTFKGPITFQGESIYLGGIEVLLPQGIAGLAVKPSPQEPFVFLLTANGFVYISGRGTVSLVDGQVITFPK